MSRLFSFNLKVLREEKGGPKLAILEEQRFLLLNSLWWLHIMTLFLLRLSLHNEALWKWDLSQIFDDLYGFWLPISLDRPLDSGASLLTHNSIQKLSQKPLLSRSTQFGPLKKRLTFYEDSCNEHSSSPMLINSFLKAFSLGLKRCEVQTLFKVPTDSL